jgi:hypothetical protein
MEETKRADNKQNQRMIMRMSKQIKYEDIKFMQNGDQTGAAHLSQSISGGESGKNITVTQDNFLFGTEAALEYEEYLVLKTNRHSIR